MYTYTHKARHKNAKGMILSAITLTSGIFFLVLALKKSGNFSSLFHILAIILFILASTLISRFVFTEYEYASDGKLFTVTEVRMKKKTVSVRIYLTEIDEIISVKRRRDARRRKLKCKIFDCRADLAPKEYHILVLRSENFCNEGEEIRILIQPDKKMSDILEGHNEI